MINLFKRRRGSAVVFHKGQAFFTKNASAVALELNPSDVGSDAYGPLKKIHNNRLVSVTFTPVGVFTEAQLAVLYPFRSYQFGQYNTPVINISAVDTVDDKLTVTGHGLVAGTGVRIGGRSSGATVPTGTTENSLYFAGVVDADTVTLHTSEADAIAGTNKLNMTSTGTGPLAVVVNSPMVIHTIDGERLVLHNAGCVEQPSLNLTAIDSPFGQAKYEGYSINGSTWDTANSVYTLTDAPLVLPDLDPSEIPTVPYTVDWDSIISGMQPREAIGVTFPMQLGDLMSDADGIHGRSIQSIAAQAQFLPINTSMQDLLDELAIQGTGAARGQDIPGADLNIYGPSNNPYLRIYGASLLGLPTAQGTNEDRIGQLTFASKRTFASGQPNPVFYIGASAPA